MRRLILASRRDHFHELQLTPGAELPDAAEVKTNIENLVETEQEIERLVPEEGEVSCLSCDAPVFGANNPPDVSQFLYHYTRSPVLPNVRKTQSLRFRPLSAMNDPYEALDISIEWFGLYGRDPLTSEENDRWQSTDWVAEINRYRQGVKIGAFAQDRLPDLTSTSLEPPYTRIGERVLGQRGFAHPRMWSQYGADGTGVCLVLDFDRLRTAFEEALPDGRVSGYGSVAYVEDPSFTMPSIRTLLEGGPEGLLLERDEDLLRTKHIDWENEAEYRFFVADDAEPYFTLPIGNSVVAGLVLGPRFDYQKHGRYVTTFCRDFGIRSRVCQVTWRRGSAQLLRQLPPP